MAGVLHTRYVWPYAVRRLLDEIFLRPEHRMLRFWRS